MPDPVKVKGTALNSTLRYVADHFGPDAVEAVTAGLPAGERDAIRNGVLVSQWYRFGAMAEIMRETRRLHGAKTPDLYRDMGRASADYALTTIYKIFFKVGSPQFIITRAASVYGNYYSAGSATVIDSGRGYATLALRDFPEPSEEYCHRVWGWVLRMLELSGASQVVCKHDVCVLKGDKECRIDGTWSGS